LGSNGPRSDGARHGDPARIAAALERAVAAELPLALPRQRWFGAKGRAITGTRVRDCGPLGDRAWLTLVDVTFAEGPGETYAIPLVLDADEPTEACRSRSTSTERRPGRQTRSTMPDSPSSS